MEKNVVKKSLKGLLVFILKERERLCDFQKSWITILFFFSFHQTTTNDWKALKSQFNQYSKMAALLRLYTSQHITYIERMGPTFSYRMIVQGAEYIRLTRMLKLAHRVIGHRAIKRAQTTAGYFLKKAKEKLSLFNRFSRISHIMAKSKESMQSYLYGCSLLRRTIQDIFFETFSYVIHEARPDLRTVPDLSRQRE